MIFLCHVTPDTRLTSFFLERGGRERGAALQDPTNQCVYTCNDMKYKFNQGTTGAADTRTIQSLFVQNSCQCCTSVQRPNTFSQANNMKFYAVLLHFAKFGDLRIKVRFQTKIGPKKSDFEQKFLQNSTISRKIPKSYFEKKAKCQHSLKTKTYTSLRCNTTL